MKQIILTLSIIILFGLSSPIMSQEKTPTIEKKVMIIRSSDIETKKGENIWINKDGESVDPKGNDMIFIGEDAIESEKEISVNVNNETRDGEEIRIYEVTINEDGEEKIIKWEDTDDIPEDVANMLKAEGIDIQMFQSDEMTVRVDASSDENTSNQSIQVNVDVDEDNGETERTVEVIIEEDGEKQIMKWKDNGETSAEIQEKLDELGIDLDIAEDGEYREDVEVIIEKSEGREQDNEDEELELEKRMYKIDLSNGGEVPSEIREQLEEYGVDLDKIIEEAKEQKSGETTVEKKVRIIKSHDSEGSDSEIEIIRLKDGEEIPEDIKQKLKEKGIDLESMESGALKISSKKAKKHVIKLKDNNGEMKVMEWDGEGDMPVEMKKYMKELEKEGHGIHLHSKPSGNMNKVQLGVKIEESNATGILVSDVILGSAAANVGILAGDIITHVDGLQVMDIPSLLESLSNKDVGDQADITYVRDNVSYNAIAHLTEAKKMDSAEIEVIQVKVECDTENLTRDADVDGLFKSITDVKQAGDFQKFIIIKEATIDTEAVISATTEIMELPIIEKNRRLKLDGFKAFPNPTSGFINISFEGKSSPIVVQLSDISGRTVFKETLNNFSGSFNRDIDLSNAQKGQFILYVIQDQKVFSESLIVQ